MASHRVKVIELTRVSPPSGSVADTALPLTFFDAMWVLSRPVQRIFFFQYPYPTTHFLTNLLPRLKSSLSLALHLYFPLAATLVLSPQTGEHEIRYIDGDSVTLSVTESNSDFRELTQDHPKDAALFHPLVPELPSPDLLSLQLTVFPHSGFCIGVSFHHAAADGSSFMQFMRAWASISRLGEDSAASTQTLPLHDRARIHDSDGLKRVFLDQIASMDGVFEHLSVKNSSVGPRVDLVRATYVLSRAHIENLRRRYLSKAPAPTHCSSFVLACSHVWVCLTKALGNTGTRAVHFLFAVDCRARMEPPIPVTYFGNCLGSCFVNAKGSDLDEGGGEGFLASCEAIGRGIQGLEEGALKGAEEAIPRISSILAAGEHVLSVAGSPKIRVYDTDFGCGKPRKVEVISIEETGAVSLAESRDGGLEVGLVLPICAMERFASLHEEGLKDQ